MENKFIKAAKFVRKMSNNNHNEDLNQSAESAVRNHVIWSMGAGFIPIPIADFVAVAAVQLDLIRTISNIYGVDFKETEGKALVTSLTGSGLSRLGANALLKLVPGFGSMLGGVSMSIVSGASTYALGQVFKKHFAVGGTFLDFDTDRFQRYYDEQFEKGKTVANDIQKEKEDKGKVKEDEVEYTERKTQEKVVKEEKVQTDNSEIVRKLKELAELKEMGVIDDDEFAQMKARLIDNYK